MCKNTLCKSEYEKILIGRPGMLREPKVDFLIHCSDEQSDNMDAKSSSNAIHLTTNMHNLELGSLSYEFFV